MPSRLAQFRRRYDPGGSRSKARQLQVTTAEAIALQGPWGGYCPDLAAVLAGWSDFRECTGITQMGGILRAPTGWTRLDDNSLPLGDSTPPAAPGTEQPVVGLYMYPDPSAASGFTYRRYAVTANAVLGHFYELGVDWLDIPYVGAGAGLSGSPSSAGVAETLCDLTGFPTGPKIIFTNGIDPVYQHTPGGANYTDFSPAVLNPFLARSVCHAAERIIFLRTKESGTLFPNRMRYTTRSATPSFTGLGSGFLDFPESLSDGVAVRRLGNYIAVYFSGGCSLVRETGNVNDPFKKEYVGTERGLISTFAVVDIGSGRHFGIFTDGWFYFDDAAQFQQIGLRQMEDGIFPKWRTTFYRQLNKQAQHRVQIGYDRIRRQTWIAWPDSTSTDPNRLWLYDHETDTVWPMDSIFAQVPNVLARGAQRTDTTTYAGAAALFYISSLLTYADYEVKEGTDALMAGFRSGLVMTQDPRTFTVDGMAPNYALSSFLKSLDISDRDKEWDRLDLTYLQQNGAAGPDVSIGLNVDGDVESGTIAQVSEETGKPDSDYVTGHTAGRELGYEFSGQHPLDIEKLQLRISYKGGPVKRRTL